MLAPALLGLMAYASAFPGTFLFDDRTAIFADPRLASISAFVHALPGMIRPVTRLTFLFDRSLYGATPLGYHVVNVALHLASGLLVWTIVRRLGGRREVAFFTAALFLVHPLGTEAVTYISGRATGLMTAFYLAAFLAFLVARQRAKPERDGVDQSSGSGGRRAAIGLALAAACCLAVSLLSKETAIVFPGLLLLYEVVGPRAAGAARRGAACCAPRRCEHLLPTAVVAVFLAVAALHARYLYLLRYGFDLRGPCENLATQLAAMPTVLSLAIWPARLNIDHDLPVHASLFAAAPLAGLLLVVGMAAVAALLVRRAPLVAFGILWFFLHLLPTNSVFPRNDVLSERNLYLPLVGLCLAAAAGVSSLAERWGGRRAAAGLAVAVVLVLAGTTAFRNRLYADPIRFWEDAVSKSPGKARPHTNLGVAFFEAGESEKALDEFRAALSLDPNDAVAQRNLREGYLARAGRPRHKDP